MLDGQLAAGLPNSVARGGWLDKLKSVAEGIALANQRENLNSTERDGEFEADQFANRDFLAQHGGDSRFTQIDRVAIYHAAIARIDTDGDIEAKTRLLSGVMDVAFRARDGLTYEIQTLISAHTLAAQNYALNTWNYRQDLGMTLGVIRSAHFAALTARPTHPA